MTGITSSLPIHMTPINIHFEITGMSGETNPVFVPTVENAETTSKTTSVIEKGVLLNWKMQRVAMNMVRTERMMTSMFFAASSSAVGFGITRPSILNGMRTLPVTYSRRNHHSSARKASATLPQFDSPGSTTRSSTDKGEHCQKKDSYARPRVKICRLEAGRCERGDSREQALFERRQDVEVCKKDKIVGKDSDADGNKKEEEFDLLVTKQAQFFVFDNEIIQFERKRPGDHNGNEDKLKNQAVVVRDATPDGW